MNCLVKNLDFNRNLRFFMKINCIIKKIINRLEQLLYSLMVLKQTAIERLFDIRFNVRIKIKVLNYYTVTLTFFL